ASTCWKAIAISIRFATSRNLAAWWRLNACCGPAPDRRCATESACGEVMFASSQAHERGTHHARALARTRTSRRPLHAGDMGQSLARCRPYVTEFGARRYGRRRTIEQPVPDPWSFGAGVGLGNGGVAGVPNM